MLIYYTNYKNDLLPFYIFFFLPLLQSIDLQSNVISVYVMRAIPTATGHYEESSQKVIRNLAEMLCLLCDDYNE